MKRRRDKLDLEWARHFIYKYEQEHDFRIRKDKDEIDAILRKLMYEKDFYCEEQDLEDIVDELFDEI